MDTYIDSVYPSLCPLTPTLVDAPTPSLELVAPPHFSAPTSRPTPSPGIKSKDKV